MLTSRAEGAPGKGWGGVGGVKPPGMRPARPHTTGHLTLTLPEPQFLLPAEGTTSCSPSTHNIQQTRVLDSETPRAS